MRISCDNGMVFIEENKKEGSAWMCIVLIKIFPINLIYVIYVRTCVCE